MPPGGHLLKLTSSTGTILWLVLYALCSMLMLLCNKAVLLKFPFPLALTCVQLLFAATFTFPIVCYRGFTKLSRRSSACYGTEGLLFSVTIFAGLKSLNLTSVGTVTLARCCLPIVVYFTERVFGKSSVLSKRSCLSLLGVTSFGSVYAVGAKGFQASPWGLCWTAGWLILLACQMVYGKWLISAVKLAHLERVYYTNICGLPFLLPLARKEFVLLPETVSTTSSFILIFVSCVIGVGIGYTSWRLRAVTSATFFCLVGVLNKAGTICAAFLIWPKEGSFSSFLALIGCIVSGFFYEGSSNRKNARSAGV